MNKHLQNILSLIPQDAHLKPEEKLTLIKEAEAVNKELEIEAALESVRARTICMKRSDELAETAVLLFEQLKSLGVDLRGCGFNIWEKDEKTCTTWMNTPTGGFMPPFQLSLTEDPLFRRFYESRQNGEDFWVYETGEKELAARYRYLATIPVLGEFLEKDRTENLEIPKSVIDHVVNFSKGNLIFITYEPCPEAWYIFKRFGKVFEQTYTRFLDLQKAEAQARESQIQLALERVRARTMAMRRSDELGDVALAMFEQVKELGIESWATGFNIWQEDNESYIDWMIGPTGEFMEPYKVDLTAHPIFIEISEARKRGEDFHVFDFQGRALKEAYDLLSSFVTKKEFEKFSASGFQMPSRQINHYVYGSKASLLFITYEPYPEAHDIFKRFGKVFEQTYTRFLDLQKAEAQAREANIETALERVRSRTMAMHKSEELGPVATILFNELRQLVGNLWASGFALCDREKTEDEYWSCTETGMHPPMYVSHTGQVPAHKNMYEAWKAGANYYAEEGEGESLKAVYDYMMTLPTVRPAFENILAGGFSFPTWQQWHAAYFKYGYVFIITLAPFGEENIFKRFAQVFSQAYTRFLDLQKAEAQARESQIQLAMERVRAKTMAMQHSEELAESASLLFKQIADLGTKSWSSGFDIWEADEISATAWMSNPDGSMGKPFIVPYTEDPFFKQIYNARQSGTHFFVMESGGRELEETYQYLFNLPDAKKYFDGVESLGFQMPTFQITHCAFFSQGFLMFITYEPVPEMWDVFKRFAKVFEQTYKRFLDLQKAETQAKEAQIEAALERVRSRSMGMQKSNELKEVIQVVFEQFVSLNIHIEHTGFVMDYKARNDYDIWIADYLGVPNHVIIPYFDSVYYNRFNEAKAKGEDFFATNLSFEEKNRFYQKIIEYIPGVSEEIKEFLFSIPGLAASTVLLDNVCLYIENFSGISYTDEENTTLMRFGKVFQQTYTRFLDLQKAEAQSRESQIELGLERVRAKAMAMQTSEELNALIGTVFRELTILDLVLTRCVIMIYDAATKGVNWWIANSEAPSMPMNFFVKYHELPFFHACLKAWNERTIKWQYILEGTAKKELDDFIFTETELSLLPDFVIAGMRAPDRVYLNASFNNFGNLLLASLEPLSDEHFDILLRFAKVFDLTYTRFNDLKQAEAQARESQIQLALERVRARTMAMQKSVELPDAALLLSTQVKELGIQLWSTSFQPWDNDRKAVTAWTALKDIMLKPFKIPATEDSLMINISDAAKKGELLYVEEMGGKVLENHVKYMNSLPGVKEEFGKVVAAGFSFPSFNIFHAAYFSTGFILFITEKPCPEAHDIFKRFAKVFEQTYTRFLDLQKAEEQARESQIEAALERVRSRSMGMQKSEELREIIQVIYEQFIQLGIKIDSAGFATDYVESDDFNFWFADSYSTFPKKVHVPYFNHPQFNRFKEAKEKGLDFYASKLTFEEKNKFFDHILKNAPPIPQELKEVFYSAPGYISSHAVLKNIVLYILNYTDIPFSDAENATLIRFAKVFEQTYIRFNDLKQAESQALEAVKRASVDRIRAEIASMRTTNDLERITPLIWTELTTLGVSFIRCGVFIMDEDLQKVHTFLSTPEGKAIATLHVPFQFNLTLISNCVSHWRKKKIYKEYWDANTFTKSWTALSSLSETSGGSHQSEHPPENLYLHLLPFLQGMLYVGNDTPMKEDELQLVQNLADAFSTAYARYEDFNKLETAKKQVDSTLNELQATQKQLIQSEKMASLGELTAGIAHEIQNPLNFVNNFSEVNKELLAELNEEIEKGNYGEVKMIAADIAGNEEKISHHGKRADSIVKGMLQHSRSSTGIKEPTDINALADEYLRLSYHGLRAKDNSFNAAMQTDFDPDAGKINIVPQDIGRVFLNLFNNAFYATNEKKKTADGNYKPLISIQTKKTNNDIEIKVADNGNGIPASIKEKIFQPFFTTKPTGQGTGLGLSLSYDIIKAHNGEIKVETTAQAGTEFVVLLPV